MSNSIPTTSSVLIGSSAIDIHLIEPVTIPLHLDPDAVARVCTQITDNSPSDKTYGKFYISLEQVRGDQEGVTLEIYVNHNEQNILIATEGLFGLKMASKMGKSQGLTLTADISSHVAGMLSNPENDRLQTIDIHIKTRLPLTPATALSIKRIAIYYEK